MGFLSTTGNVIEAVLTRKGREKLAKGNFNITKYAFSDDGINYNLYNENLGADADADILSIPITQPSTNAAAIKNLLVTMDPGSQLLTWLAVNPNSGSISPTKKSVSIYAKTMNKDGAGETYDIVDINNQTAWEKNIAISQSFVGSEGQTNIQFSYRMNANLSESLTFKFKIRGKETGILSDEISLVVEPYVGVGTGDTNVAGETGGML